MINHCRTLLLNRDGHTAPDPCTYPGEEYVPPDYRAVALTPSLGRVCQALFGSRPDRPYLNWRLRQLLSVLHTGPLEPDLLVIDPRVTYWQAREPESVFDRWGVYGSVTTHQIEGSAIDLPFIGRPAANDGAGQAYSQWRISCSAAGLVQVVREDYPGLTPYSSTPTFTNGLSELIDMPGSGLKVRIPGPDRRVWAVDALARPDLDFAGVAARVNSLAIDDVTETFNLAGPAASSARSYWDQSPFPTYRLSAVVLALAYATDAIRTGGQT